MSDINFSELVLQHEELKKKYEEAQGNLKLVAQIRDNFANAMNNLTAHAEQLYADVADSLPEQKKAFWRAHLGLPVKAMARSYSAFDFATAVLLLKAGRRVQRAGWNGKGMWLELIKQYQLQLDATYLQGEFKLHPFIVMKTADNQFVPWLASQTDLLAADWELWVPPEVAANDAPLENIPLQ